MVQVTTVDVKRGAAGEASRRRLNQHLAAFVRVDQQAEAPQERHADEDAAGRDDRVYVALTAVPEEAGAMDVDLDGAAVAHDVGTGHPERQVQPGDQIGREG